MSFIQAAAGSYQLRPACLSCSAVGRLAEALQHYTYALHLAATGHEGTARDGLQVLLARCLDRQHPRHALVETARLPARAVMTIQF